MVLWYKWNSIPIYKEMDVSTNLQMMPAMCTEELYSVQFATYLI